MKISVPLVKMMAVVPLENDTGALTLPETWNLIA
jgi:hypothetical protein